MIYKIYQKNVSFFLFFLIFMQSAFAQRSQLLISKASISGVVKDSVTKNLLNRATITLYNAANGSVIKTISTNLDGSFTLRELPVGSSLKLMVSYTGYAAYKKVFTIQMDKKNYGFGTILLACGPNDLKTVDVLGKKTTVGTVLGSIKGKVKDSTYKFTLSSATVSVYNNDNFALLQFTMPNNFGEFSIHKLPVNTSLKLLITHVGYTPYQKIFSLSESKNALNFDWIYMHQNTDKENTLEEVRITSIAPVRMNGDTLEFNPRAFKMDVNATAEDLMRNLPGMVIWGDGDITFNGKKINSLLVDGKPFMGSSDFTTATQNLPKDVLDKVQIYSQRNDKNPLDSTLHANLKLKEDKKTGYFGKVALGYGTTDKFAIDAMLSGYNKKLQITNVGAFNNVNKSAGNFNTLIRSNSYKGEGNNIDYQSDFTKAGINTGITAGTRFQYDFIPDVSYRKSRRLTGDYFFKRNDETINSTRITNTILNTDSILSNNNISKSNNIAAKNSFLAKYAHQNKDYDFSVSADANLSQNKNQSESIGEQQRTGTIGQLSSSSSSNSSDNIRKQLTVDATFNYRKEIFDDDDFMKIKKHLLSNFTLGYKLDYHENNGDRRNLSSLISMLNPDANKVFDRLYQSSSNLTGHTFNIGYPQLKKVLFGFANLGGIRLDLGSKFIFSSYNSKVLVFDKVVNNQQFVKNNYLTNNRMENIQDIQPKLIISKYFNQELTNRYNKGFDISIVPMFQIYTTRSHAVQQIQNFSYQYQKFVPSASITYYNHQYGNYELNGGLSYNTQVNYPTVEEIAPLVDSAKVWYIPQGNRDIKPEYKNTVALKFTFQSRRPKNPYQIELNIDGNFTNNKISDSTFYDSLGRRINYNVNLNGNNYWHLSGYYRKAYSPNKKNTFRINIWYNRYEFYIPQYLDGVLMTSNNRNNNFDIEAAYSFSDMVNLNFKQGFSFYKNIQSTNSQQYQGSNNYTRFSSALQFPKNILWSTNINFNTNKAENQSTVNYTILNASLTYRFLKGSRGEAKFSALDLLKQNKAVINNTNRNVQTFGFSNVLQQYFLVSLAYYPRKFGKKISASEE